MNSTSAQPLPSQSAGAWLTRQMERRSISVRHMAAQMNVADKTVYDWRGDRGVISEERVPLLAQVLGMTEIETRRGLGFWVPDGDEPKGAELRDELIELRGQLQAILDRIDEIREQ